MARRSLRSGRHETPKAVSARSETFDALDTEFEDLLQRMQTPAARKGMEMAFNAALGRAATKTERRLIRAVLWQRVQGTGLERFELLQDPDGWVLRGAILALEKQGPAQANYEILCDAAWHTLRAVVSLRDGIHDRSLALTVEDGRWVENGNERPAVRGCIDIDLGWSPSTNTLPIRRLGLAVGQKSGPVTAAWVRFPELTLEPLPQEYERLAERRYRYSSRGGAFTAELEIDEDGLVVDYQGIWRRVSG